MEWDEWRQQLCSGCNTPRSESFDIDNQFAYRAEAWECFSCAETQRQQWADSRDRSAGSPPLFGRYYAAVKKDD